MAQSNMTQLKDLSEIFKEFPVHNKDNFKVYLDDQYVSGNKERSGLRRNYSMYPTTTDTSNDDKIINEPKPEITLRYLNIRGNSYCLEKSGINKKKKTSNSAKA